MKKLLLYYIITTRWATAPTLVRHLIGEERAKARCATRHPSAHPPWNFRRSDCRLDNIIAVASRRGISRDSGNRLKSKIGCVINAENTKNITMADFLL